MPCSVANNRAFGPDICNLAVASKTVNPTDPCDHLDGVSRHLQAEHCCGSKHFSICFSNSWIEIYSRCKLPGLHHLEPCPFDICSFGTRGQVAALIADCSGKACFSNVFVLEMLMILLTNTRLTSPRLTG